MISPYPFFPNDSYGVVPPPGNPSGDVPVPGGPYGELPSEDPPVDDLPPLGDLYGYPPLPDEYDGYLQFPEEYDEYEDDVYVAPAEEGDGWAAPPEFQILQVAVGSSGPAVPASGDKLSPVEGLEQARVVRNLDAYCSFSGERVRDCNCQKHRGKG